MELRKKKVYVSVCTDSPSLLVVPYQGGDKIEDIVEEREGYFLTEEELDEYRIFLIRKTLESVPLRAH